MRERHFTKNTVEASAWCKVCGKDAPHFVSGGRLGSCLVCIKRQKPQASPEKPKEPEQMTLIERYGVLDIG